MPFADNLEAECAVPLKSSWGSLSLLGDPPHNVTKASMHRTLMPKLLVLLKTAATAGKKSFLIVEKSRMLSVVDMLPNALSTIA